jgi:hypothetical protein
MSLRVLSLALLVVSGCSTSVDTNVDPLATITQGLYGQALVCNGDCKYGAGLHVAGFTSDPPPFGQTPFTLLGDATANGDHGFFQIMLPAGKVSLCIDINSTLPGGGPQNWSCTDVSVSGGSIARHDWMGSGNSGAWN